MADAKSPIYVGIVGKSSHGERFIEEFPKRRVPGIADLARYMPHIAVEPAKFHFGESHQYPFLEFRSDQ